MCRPPGTQTAGSRMSSHAPLSGSFHCRFSGRARAEPPQVPPTQSQRVPALADGRDPGLNTYRDPHVRSAKLNNLFPDSILTRRWKGYELARGTSRHPQPLRHRLYVLIASGKQSSIQNFQLGMCFSSSLNSSMRHDDPG